MQSRVYDSDIQMMYKVINLVSSFLKHIKFRRLFNAI